MKLKISSLPKAVEFWLKLPLLVPRQCTCMQWQFCPKRNGAQTTFVLHANANVKCQQSASKTSTSHSHLANSDKTCLLLKRSNCSTSKTDCSTVIVSHDPAVDTDQ